MIDKIKSALNPVPVMINSEDLFNAVFYKFKRESQAQKLSTEEKEVVRNILGLLELLHADTFMERFNIDKDRGVCREFWDWDSPPSIQALSDDEINELYDAINKMSMQRQIMTLSYGRKQKFLIFMCIRLDDIIELFDIEWSSSEQARLSLDKILPKVKSLASKAKKLRKQDSEVAELLTVMAYIPYAVFSGTTKLSVVGDSLVKDIDLDTYEIGAIFNKMFGGVQDIHAILSCIGDKNTCFDYLFGKRPGFDQYCEELEDLIESTKFGATLQSSTGPISFSDLAGKAKSTITRSRQKRDKYFESMGFDMSGGKDMRNNVVTMPGVQLNEVGNNRVAPQVVSRSNMQPTSSYRQQVVNTETPRTILGKEQIASFMSKVVAVSATGVKTTFSIPEINIQNQDFVMFSYYEECVGPTKMQECWQFRSDLKKALKAGPLKATFVIHSGNGVAATLDLGEFLKLDDNRKYGNKYAKNLYSFRKEEFAANDVEYAKSQVAGTTVSKKKFGADISDPFDSLDDSGKSVFGGTGTTTVKHIEKDPYADDLDFETKSVFN